MYIYIYIYTWVSINGGTPKSYNFNRIFHEINTPAIGVPPFMETLIYIYIYIYIYTRTIPTSSHFKRLFVSKRLNSPMISFT